MGIVLILNVCGKYIKMENVDLDKLRTGGENMLRFINENLTHPIVNLKGKCQFLLCFKSFTLGRNINKNAVVAINPEDGEILYSTEDILAGLEQLDDDDNVIYNLSNMLKEELTSYIKKLSPEQFDGDAHSQNLDIALQNILAVFNVANLVIKCDQNSRKH